MDEKWGVGQFMLGFLRELVRLVDRRLRLGLISLKESHADSDT
jgi:hypothetical protein